MSGNSIGKVFTLSTFGESHGLALGAVVDGCPPNLKLSISDIQKELDRRKPGTSRYTSPRREADQVKILSGVFEGKTTGTPIGLLIENLDTRSQDYANIKDKFRPAHADYTYEHKYGIRDYRGGGRSSARETAMRVAAGAIAKKYLADKLGISIFGFLSQLGTIELSQNHSEFDPNKINSNPFFCGIESKVKDLEKFINQLKKEGDSIGAKVTIIANKVPVGLGEPVFDKLDADIAKAMMSINAVKGVEIGEGFNVVTQKGSEHRDMLTKNGFTSNNSGGILGGISTGQPIVVNLAIKPTSSISISGKTINTLGEEVEIATKGRHDPCVGIRATPIGEAQLALVLMDHYCRNRAQNADSSTDLPDIEKNSSK